MHFAQRCRRARIPDDRPLEEGDLLSVDTGVVLDGYYGDAAVSVIIGRADPDVQRLVDVTRTALESAIGECRPGNRLSEVSHAVQELACLLYTSDAADD